MKDESRPATSVQRIMFMVCLIVAGEAVFALPFHVARFFRPTVLEVFGFTNTQLGAVQSVYGITAMLSYFPGGPLADRFSARRLLTGSLLSTAVGGLYFATTPDFTGMRWLFAFFGVTTILLFWAALIRATREWGGSDAQGRAYGILDGGRGLFAAVTASAAVVLFQLLMPDDPTLATDQERLASLRSVILTYTGATAVAAGLVWMFVPETTPDPGAPAPPVWRNIRRVLRLRSVWLQALIVICAYVAYKGIDDYSLFAVQAYGMNEVEGARVTAITTWVRPVAPLVAGILGDRLRSSRVITVGFAILIVSYLVFALIEPNPAALWILWANVVVTCVAIFGFRGVYFALFEEAGLPIATTGVAVGFVSFVGYTPDVFVNLVAGILIDRSPGAAGHQHFFLFLTVFAAIGMVASMVFHRTSRAGRDPTPRDVPR